MHIESPEAAWQWKPFIVEVPIKDIKAAIFIDIQIWHVSSGNHTWMARSLRIIPQVRMFLLHRPFRKNTKIYIITEHGHIQRWLVVYLPLWKIWVRQLGWWHSQDSYGKKKTCSKAPIRMGSSENMASPKSSEIIIAFSLQLGDATHKLDPPIIEHVMVSSVSEGGGLYLAKLAYFTNVSLGLCGISTYGVGESETKPTKIAGGAPNYTCTVDPYPTHAIHHLVGGFNNLEKY